LANLPKTLLIDGIHGQIHVPEMLEHRHAVFVFNMRVCPVSEQEPDHIDIEPVCGKPQRSHATGHCLVDGLVGTTMKEEPSHLQQPVQIWNRQFATLALALVVNGVVWFVSR
jgi:hypothetical protein